MNQLILGDCLEQMGNMPEKSVDMILCDPPYGIDFQSCRIKDKLRRKPKIKNDKRPFVEFIPFVKRILKPTGCAMVFTPMGCPTSLYRRHERFWASAE